MVPALGAGDDIHMRTGTRVGSDPPDLGSGDARCKSEVPDHSSMRSFHMAICTNNIALGDLREEPSQAYAILNRRPKRKGFRAAYMVKLHDVVRVGLPAIIAWFCFGILNYTSVLGPKRYILTQVVWFKALSITHIVLSRLKSLTRFTKISSFAVRPLRKGNFSWGTMASTAIIHGSQIDYIKIAGSIPASATKFLKG